MRNYFRFVTAMAVLYVIGAAAFIYYIKSFAGGEGETASQMISGLIAGLIMIGAILLLIALLYGSFLAKHVTVPLSKMKKMSKKIAEGNFDWSADDDNSVDLKMFTDSFGVMKGELARSRQREIDLREKERELMATLGKQLKTPITGLRLNAELLKTNLLLEKDSLKDAETVIGRADRIYTKAEQMETLISDMLSSTMDDLGDISVSCSDVESRILEDMVNKYDVGKRALISPIPFVLIHIDTRRMNQVVESILDNAYKYAGTDIDVGFLQTDDFLQMSITDRGPGVSEDEIELITDRFYRSRRWAGSDIEGSGLGLYTARTIMEKMGGQLYVENTGEGLCVRLLIRLS